MKSKLTFLLVSILLSIVTIFYACRKDHVASSFTDRNPVPLTARTCIELPLPADAKFKKVQLIPAHPNPLIKKGWIVDYAAWTQVFHSDSSQLYAYLRANAATVSYIQRRINISVAVSYLKIFTTPDTLDGDLNKFSAYCGENLSGKVNADGFTFISYTYHLKGGGGISWVGGLGTTNYNSCVCGIEGNTSWAWAAFTIPSLSYAWDPEVIAHEEGHLYFNLQHTHCGDSTYQKIKQDDCGGAEGFSEGCESKEPNLRGCPSTDTITCTLNLQCTFPTDSGYIMSYCHLIQGVGISLVRGYGSFDSTKASIYIAANEQYLLPASAVLKAFNY